MRRLGGVSHPYGLEVMWNGYPDDARRRAALSEEVLVDLRGELYWSSILQSPPHEPDVGGYVFVLREGFGYYVNFAADCRSVGGKGALLKGWSEVMEGERLGCRCCRCVERVGFGGGI